MWICLPIRPPWRSVTITTWTGRIGGLGGATSRLGLPSDWAAPTTSAHPHRTCLRILLLRLIKLRLLLLLQGFLCLLLAYHVELLQRLLYRRLGCLCGGYRGTQVCWIVRLTLYDEEILPCV